MLIDLHMHSTYSFDSKLTIEQIVEVAKEIGLDGVCITDHESIGFMHVAKLYSEKLDFPIFAGFEYLTKQGDIVAIGIDEVPSGEMMDAQDFIDYVNERGGATIAVHPFRHNNRGLSSHLLKVTGLAGIEVLNGSTSPEANQVAMDYCDKLGLSPTGASDAHIARQVGRYATWFPDDVKSVEDMVRALKKKETRPAVLSGYKVL